MRKILKYVACTVAALVAMTLVGQAAAAPEPLARPDWPAIFGLDGKVVNLQGGIDAFFMEDKISDGIGLDMSALAAGDTKTVHNLVVAGADDLGDGYVWARTDAGGNLQIYAGVERLDLSQDTYVEFEFNQGVVQVGSGTPWPVRGGRTPGDVLVRVNFVAGALSSAAFMRWNGASYQPVAGAGPGGYDGPDYLVCVGAPPLPPIAQATWDAAGYPVQVIQPNSFVEVGFNVAPLAGAKVEFTSVQVRTPGDVILDGFRHMGSWARHAQGGGQS